MKHLASIESIETVYDTGCKPLLVHASDLNFYVCKYHHASGTAEKLFREYLAASFAKLWDIRVPDFAFVTVLPEHLPPELGVRAMNLHYPTFGSFHNREYKEVDKFLYSMSEYETGKFTNAEEFLTIGFFDLWLANDDRHSGNFNLFVTVEDDGFHFVVFDHEAIFNTGNLDKGLCTLTEEDSILSSPLVLKLLSRKQLADRNYLDSLKKKWYVAIEVCMQNVQTILQQVPNEWNINRNQKQKLLNQHLFNDAWFEECYHKFLELIQLNLNKSHEHNV